MHRIKVRRMGSNILVIENGKPFMAKPEGWNKTGIVNSLKRAFTLKYEIYGLHRLNASPIYGLDESRGP